MAAWAQELTVVEMPIISSLPSFMKRACTTNVLGVPDHTFLCAKLFLRSSVTSNVWFHKTTYELFMITI
jgi:hypothetical protein